MKSIDEFGEEVLSNLSDALDTSLELLGYSVFNIFYCN